LPTEDIPLDNADSGMDLLLTHGEMVMNGEGAGKTNGKPRLLRLPL
jgi:hypothetical protein